MYIDTHCHLNFPQFDEDRAMVIGNAKKAGVKMFINPGVDLVSSQQAIELSQKHPGVIFAAVGFHPYEAQHDQDVNQLIKLIEVSVVPAKAGIHPRMTTNKPIVAIGECGLDYHQYKGEEALGKKDNQKRLFEDQIRIALKYDLPVIMHCRDAYEDFFTVLDNQPQIPRGVIHCFSGGLEDIRMANKRNLFVGIDGNITYSKQLQTIVPSIPLSMIVLETDAPFLPPIPHRDERNEPKYIPSIAKAVAQLYQVEPEMIQKQTTEHAFSLFHFSQ